MIDNIMLINDGAMIMKNGSIGQYFYRVSGNDGAPLASGVPE
jgi:hypothetical protein